MSRTTGSRHIVKFPLLVNPKQERRLEHIFALATSAYRELKNKVRHDMNRMELEGRYSMKRKQYRGASKEEKEGIGKELNALRTEYHLRGSVDMEKHIPAVRRHYLCRTKDSEHIRNYLPQPVCAMMVAHIAAGVDKVLTGNGRRLSSGKVDSLTAKDNHTAIVFNPDRMTVKYSNVLTLKVKCPDTDYYRKELEVVLANWDGPDWTFRTEVDADGKVHKYKIINYGQNRICFCSIVRRVVNDHGTRKYGYWLHVTLEGPPIGCRHSGLAVPKGRVAGLDPGLQTMAYYSDGNQRMIVQSDGVRNIDERIAGLQRRMDESRRTTNPERFDDKGRYVRNSVNAETGTKKWNRTACYNRLAMERRHLAQKRHDEMTTRYRNLANRIALNAETVYTEKMNYRGLARRALRTEQKAGGDYKSKARFGASIGEHAPSLFIQILTQKVEACGGRVICVPASDLKASQYDPTDGTYKKHKLKDRVLTLSDGRVVQRDMLSAFLLSCAIPTGVSEGKGRKKSIVYTYDTDRISLHLDDAVNNITVLMDELCRDGKTYPTSVGIDGWTARPGLEKAGSSSARSEVKGAAGETLPYNTEGHCGTGNKVIKSETFKTPLPPESPCL